MTLNGSAEANSTVKIYDNASLLGTATTDGRRLELQYRRSGDGALSLTATATDVAGNTSAASMP